jgi:hypothetical protein
MAYISYTGVPLYFGTNENNNTFPGESDSQNKSVIAQQVQLNYTPNIAPVRVVGKQPTKDNFNLAGPPNASISFSCYLEAAVNGDEFNPVDYTGDFTNGTTFRLGDAANGISGSGAFLNSYSYTLTPYAPVLLQCDFAIYNPLTTTAEGKNIAAAGNDSVLDATDFGQYAHGAYSTFNKGGLDDISIFEAIQYQYTAQRLPIYTVGSYNLSSCELITAEQTLSIQGDNIQKLVPITGDNPGTQIITLKDSNAQTLLTSSIQGRLNAENVSVQGGDLARGSVTITELLK